MKILIVEDDIELSNSISELLKLEEHNTVQVTNALDAEEILLEEEDINLIIIDINLEGKISGIGLTKIIREEISQILPIFIISAITDIKTIQKAYNLNINDYIKKPFEPLELLLKIKQLKQINNINQTNK